MRRQKLQLFKYLDNRYRAVIKTQHGRIIYLDLTVADNTATVTECYYVDRVKGGKYYAAPKMLKTLKFAMDRILDVIANELDRKYFGINYNYSFQDSDANEFIQIMLAQMQRKYKFLIFVGEGETIHGVPFVISTRLKNRIHRSIYLCIRYYGDNLGVIDKCTYYDRAYKARSNVMPPMLSSIFVEFNKEAIIEMVNRELNCDFTHIIFITDNSIDIANKTALCGNL